MVKFYSDTLNKWFDTAAAAEQAEKAKLEEDNKKEAKLKAAREKISQIEKQRIKEISEKDAEIDKLTEEILKLYDKKQALIEEKDCINEEANAQIREHSDIIDRCSVKISSFDSENGNKWKTLVDESGTTEEVLEKLRKSEDTIEKLLSYFGI